MTDKNFNDSFKTNQIINGEAQAVLKTLPENSIHAIVTSPPYNCGIAYDSYKDKMDLNVYKELMQGVMGEAHRVLKSGGRVMVNVPFACKTDNNTNHAYYFPAVLFTQILDELGFLACDILTWYKSKDNVADILVGNTAWGSWRSPSSPRLRAFCESILIFSKDSYEYPNDSGNESDISADESKLATRNAVFIDSHNEIVTYENIIMAKPETKMMRRIKHPAPFPEALVARLLKLYTYPQDIVLDPFNGSGTTTSVCKKLNRQYIGIDLSAEYCKTAKNRLRELSTEIDEDGE